MVLLDTIAARFADELECCYDFGCLIMYFCRLVGLIVGVDLERFRVQECNLFD